MSLIPARLAPQGQGLALEIQRGDRPKVAIPLPPQPPAVHAFAGREVIAGLRAEAISNGSRPAGNGNGVQRRAVDGQVVVIEPTGPDTLVVLNVGGYELTARLEPDFDLRPGDRAEFKLDLTNLVLFDPSTEKLIA
jgi:multiple sugar transport system ATP-binding protein